MGEEVMPAAVAPEGFQAQEGFIPGGGPELAGAFEPALILPAGGFDGPGAQRLVGQEELLGRGGALVAGLTRFEDLAVAHPVGVVGEVVDLGLNLNGAVGLGRTRAARRAMLRLFDPHAGEIVCG